MEGLKGLDGRLCTDMDFITAGRTVSKAVPARSAAEETVKEGDKGTKIPDTYPTDRVILSENWEVDDLEGDVQEFIDRMKQYYPDIQFHMQDKESTEDPAQAAADFGKGMHIVISSEFLERMGSSRDEFAKCSKVLSREAAKLSKRAGTSAGCGVFLEKDKVVAWSASAKNSEPSLPVFGGSQDNTSTQAGDIRYSYHEEIHVSGHFSQIASARTTAQVQQAIGDIQYSMMRLKVRAIYGDDEERVKAAKAVRSLQKLMNRGNKKIRRLNRERLEQCAQKKAERQSEEEKSRRLKLELKRMRSSGKSADYTLIKEGLADEAHIRSYRRYKGLQDPSARYALMAGDMVMLQPMTGADIGMAGGFSAGDITFSGGYSF